MKHYCFLSLLAGIIIGCLIGFYFKLPAKCVCPDTYIYIDCNELYDAATKHKRSWSKFTKGGG